MRTRKGAARRQANKRILKRAAGYVGGRRKLLRTAKETLVRAGVFAFRDRRAKKRQFRRLWIDHTRHISAYSFDAAAANHAYSAGCWRIACASLKLQTIGRITRFTKVAVVSPKRITSPSGYSIDHRELSLPQSLCQSE